MATIEPYETQSGTRFMVRYRTPAGVQTKKRGFVRKRDAVEFLQSIEVTKRAGEYTSLASGKATIGELGPSWLERQRGHMEPSGFRSYDSCWRNHVEPRWAATRIADVTFTDVQAWITGLAGGLSARMVANVYSVLARILDDAVRDRRIPNNHARGVRLPKRTKGKNVYLTADQLAQLADESGRYSSLVLLLGTVDSRCGEASALRVSDIDFLRRRIVLHENAVTVGSTTYLGSLKTGHQRTVPLSAFVAEALAKSCEGKEHGELIWPSAWGGYLGPPASVRSWLSGAVERCQNAAEQALTADVRRTLNGAPLLRVSRGSPRTICGHTAASEAISAGANVLGVQRMLGHTSVAMTLDTFADLFDHDLNAVADVVGIV